MKTEIKKKKMYDFGRFKKWSKKTLLCQLESYPVVVGSDKPFTSFADGNFIQHSRPIYDDAPLMRIRSIEKEYYEICKPIEKSIKTLENEKIKHFTFGIFQERLEELKELRRQLKYVEGDFKIYRDTIEKLGVFSEGFDHDNNE